MTTRMTIDQIEARGWKLKTLLVAEDGASVSALTSQGVETIAFPVYDPENGVLRIEKKDLEMVDGKPSIDGSLTFAIVPESTTK